MNTKHLLLIIIIAGFSSCSTAYKIGQTPDDVYFSPAPQVNDYVTTNNDEDKNVYSGSDEDRQIRRHIQDRRTRMYDDYDYGYSYSPYNSYSPYISYAPYNSYGYYSHNYSPYYYYSPYAGYYPYGNIYINPKTGNGITYKPRTFNLGAYQPASKSGYSNTP